MSTEGAEVVLTERREFMARYVPVITSEVPASPIRLLPLAQRSRVGAGIARKRRSDARGVE
jgi:hypothetical protein